MPRSRQRAVLVAAACCGILASALHAANLLYRARVHGCPSRLLLCPSETGSWATGDYRSYARVAEEIRTRGVLGASYYRRTPGYPLLLALTEAATGHVSPLRWAGPALAGAAAGALAGLAGWLASSARAAWLAGIAFCLWPGAYRLSQALRPDGLHAFLAVLAVGAGLRWRETGRAGSALAAGALWAATQSLRPTFFPVAAILPALLCPGRRPDRRRALGGAAIVLASLVVPAFVVGSNALREGVAVPTQVASNNLACYAVPRLLAEVEGGSFPELRARCLRRFDAVERAERPGAQLRYALAVFRAQPLATARSFAAELARQMLAPATPSRHAGLYPAWARVGPGLLLGFWLCSALGVALALRRAPAFATFALLAALLVMAPATTSHGVGPRLRLPVDLLALPFAALAVERGLRLAGGLRGRAQRVAGKASPAA